MSTSNAIRYLAFAIIVIELLDLVVAKVGAETLRPWTWMAFVLVHGLFWVVFGLRSRVGGSVETNVFRGLVAFYVVRSIGVTLWRHPWIELGNHYIEWAYAAGHGREVISRTFRSVDIFSQISWFSIAAALLMLALTLRERRLSSSLGTNKLSIEYGALTAASVGVAYRLFAIVVYFSSASGGRLADYGGILYDLAWWFFYLAVWKDVRALQWLIGAPQGASQERGGVVAWTKEN